jgi:hypothetical protein
VADRPATVTVSSLTGSPASRTRKRSPLAANSDEGQSRKRLGVLDHRRRSDPGAGARGQQPPVGAGPGSRVLMSKHEHGVRVRAQ